MKRSLLALMTCITIAGSCVAQNEWDLSSFFSVYVADEETGKVYKNSSLSAEVGYLDRNGLELYRETHSGSTNQLGNYAFQIGRGSAVIGSLTRDLFKDVYSVSYIFDIDVDGSPVTISGVREVGAVPRANAAGCALVSEDSKAFCSIGWDKEIVGISNILCPPAGTLYSAFNLQEIITNPHDPQSGGGSTFSFRSTPITDLVRLRTAPELNPDGAEISYLNIGAGLGKPMYCGPDPEFIQAMHSIRMPTLANLRYGAEVIVENYNAAQHTYAILAQNLNSEGGAIAATAPRLAILARGNGAIECGTNGLGNGYGAYGLVLNAPDDDGYKYGIVGNDGGFSFSYAGIFFGRLAGSQALMVFSDASLKEQIKTQHRGLSIVNQLHPQTYYFKKNLPYHFSSALQHGFIAQELETVLPELVSEITVPVSLHPDKMHDDAPLKYKAVAYEGLIPILTSAIQELDTKVVDQQAEIDSMKKVIADLMTRLEELEKE